MAHQGGVGDQHHVPGVFVGEDVAGGHDVGPEAFIDVVDVHGGADDVALHDRLEELELLVHLDDLHRLKAHVDVLEEVPLGHHSDDRDERQWSDQAVVTECAGRLRVDAGRIVGFD